MNYHGIIFTGQNHGWGEYMKTIGAYRIRTIAAQEGYNVRVVDHTQYLTVEEIVKVCETLMSEDLMFISLSKTFITDPELLFNIETAMSILKRMYPKVKFLVGGAGTYLPKVVPNPWDFKLVGFSEYSFVDLLDYLSGKSNQLKHQIIIKGTFNVIQAKSYPVDYDMDNLGTVWLDEDGILPTDSLPIEISRGCIFKCDFCSYELNGKKKFDYFRVKDSLVKEFQYNYEKFGVTNYVFVDDTYNDSRQKLKLIDDVLGELKFKLTFETFIKPELLAAFPEQAEQLVEQGLISCTLGIESLHPETRKSIHKTKDYYKLEKHIRDLKYNSKGWNVGIHYTMILGLPYEPVSSMMDNYKYLLELDLVDDIMYQPLYMSDVTSDPSKIESNPENYGYTIETDSEKIRSSKLMMGMEDANFKLWSNSHTNFEETWRLSERLFFNELENRYLSGIGTVGQIRCLGVPDMHDEKRGLRKVSIASTVISREQFRPQFQNRVEKYFSMIK